MTELADTKAIRRAAFELGLRPPPRLSLSEWADANFYLSAESSAVAGRWTTLPYQREIMDAMTDPRVTEVTVIKSARVGYTLMLSAAVAYYIAHAPSSILLVQPTVEDAKGFSKETIDPMMRDVPALSAIVFADAEDDAPKAAKNTIRHKTFPGGVLSLTGANAGSGFRRISRKIIGCDEVDAYPPSAGKDGDPVELAKKRSEYFWDRKIFLGSTPLVAGHSRIESAYEAGDQSKFYVPCPHCGHMDFLTFRENPAGGHYMVFDSERPRESAHFVCRKNGCVIEHHEKRDMVSAGEWRAAKPFKGHRSFWIWAGYSFSPNAEWGQIAEEFLIAKRGGAEKLRAFVNTVLGETWKESGEAPDWERLYSRRETYALGSVPAGVQFITAGVDVQKDRWVYEVVGWGLNRESWSIDAGVIPGDTSKIEAWSVLDELLNREFTTSTGDRLKIRMLAVDSGYQTQVVYSWCRRHDLSRVIATKGVSTARTLISSPTAVDVAHNGQKLSRGYKVWPIGVDLAKAELYGWLKLSLPIPPETFPVGWCHFPEHAPEFFKQLTAEHLVSSTNRRGYTVLEWQCQPNRENHWLDARVMARAAAAVLGLDRVVPRSKPAQAVPPLAKSAPSTPSAPKEKQLPRRSPGGFLKRGKPWL